MSQTLNHFLRNGLLICCGLCSPLFCHGAPVCCWAACGGTQSGAACGSICDLSSPAHCAASVRIRGFDVIAKQFTGRYALAIGNCGSRERRAGQVHDRYKNAVNESSRHKLSVTVFFYPAPQGAHPLAMLSIILLAT